MSYVDFSQLLLPWSLSTMETEAELSPTPNITLPLSITMGTEAELAPTPNVKTFIPLHFWTCFFLDSENAHYPTVDPNLEFLCFTQGKHLTEEKVGRLICIIIVGLIYLVGMFGFATNVLNVIVLQRSLNKGKGASVSMRKLLIILAVSKMLACAFSIGFSTVIITISENINRSEVTFISLKVFNILFGFARTAAIYLTILVTMERYLVVAFPIQSKSWLSPAKSKIYLAIVFILAIVLDIPWMLNSTVEKNPYIDLAPNTTIIEFPYIMIPTYFGSVIYPKLRHFQLTMNFVVPFPFLLIFNFLLYKSIHTWNKSRKPLSRTQRKEINSAKMFSIVVLVLLSCHTVSCVLYFTSEYLLVIHREFLLLQNFTIVLSAAANFLVYFRYFGTAFRREVKGLLCSADSSEVVTGGQQSGPDTGMASSKDCGGETSVVAISTIKRGKRKRTESIYSRIQIFADI